jgi:hypothetical protein
MLEIWGGKLYVKCVNDCSCSCSMCIESHLSTYVWWCSLGTTAALQRMTFTQQVRETQSYEYPSAKATAPWLTTLCVSSPRSSGGKPPTSPSWNLGSHPGLSMRVLRSTKWHWDRVFPEFFSFPLWISFHHGSPCSYITRNMNNRHVSGRSSEI